MIAIAIMINMQIVWFIFVEEEGKVLNYEVTNGYGIRLYLDKVLFLEGS